MVGVQLEADLFIFLLELFLGYTKWRVDVSVLRSDIELLRVINEITKLKHFNFIKQPCLGYV